MKNLLTLFIALSFSAPLLAEKPLTPEQLHEGIYKNPQTLDVYDSRGPRWVNDLISNGWWEAEFVTKTFEDSTENHYDEALSCAEDEGFTMEDFELYEFELEFEVKAVKDAAKMADYRAGRRSSRPKTLAYALVPYVSFSFSVADGHVSNCHWYGSGAEYMFFHNDKKKPVFLGSKFDFDDEVRAPR